jgi:hypothetical protein
MPNPIKNPKPSRAAQIAKCICEVPAPHVQSPYMFWTRPLNQDFKLKKLHKTILEKIKKGGWYSRDFNYSFSSWKKVHPALLELMRSGYIVYGELGVIECNEWRRMTFADKLAEAIFVEEYRPGGVFHYLNHFDE